ncbi:MAG TPA: PAS-domain containing protein, partial [Stellaceae bacterium]|nr:PAS-domain containing protein [Stellaceae bacterium]
MDSSGMNGAGMPSAAAPRHAEPEMLRHGRAAPDRRRLTRRIVAGAVMVSVVILGLTAATWWRLRQDQRDDSLSDLSALNLLIAAQTQRSFAAIDILLSDISGDLQARGIVTAARLRQAMGDDATQRLLGAKMGGMRQLDELAIVGADGDVLARASRSSVAAPANVVNRSYFLSLRDHPELKSYISPPTRSPGGAWTIYIGRRLSAPNSAFIGFILGAIRLPYFESLYRADLDALGGAGKSVALWGSNGTLLARAPVPPQNLSGSADEAADFRRLPLAGGLASFWTADSTGTVAVAARRLDDFPVTIETRQAASAVLSLWTDEFLATEFCGAALLGLVGLATWLLLRQLGAADLVTEARARAAREAGEREDTQRAMTKAEAAMREAQRSEARFRDIAEVASDWIWETDAQHRFTMIAGAKRPNNNLIGQTRWEQAGADAETDETWRQHRAELDAHHAFRQFRFTVRLPSGQFYACVNGKPIFDDDGSFVGYRGTATDETELVEARQRAERAETLLRGAIDSIAEGFVICDADDRFVMCNEAYRRMYTANADAMVPGTKYEDIMRSALRTGRYPDAVGREEEWLAAWMRKHREGGEPEEKQLADGRWVLVSERRMPDGGIAGLRIDITALKAVHASLRESQVMLSRAQRLSSTGSVIRNLKSNVAEWSDEMYRIFGVARESFIPSTEAFLSHIHSDDRARVAAAIQAGNDGVSTAPMQFQIIRPDGTMRWVYRDAEVWADPAGAPTVLLTTYKDITDQRTAEARQRELEILLRDAIDSISEGFVIYDAEDRLVLCNDAYRRLYPESAEFMVPGTRFEDLLRAGINHARLRDGKIRDEAWFADRMRRHREVNEAVETRLEDGRWIMISERRTSSGGTAGLRVDITALKTAQEALHEKEKMLSRAQRISATGSAIRDFRTGKTEWSDEMYRICGVTPENFTPGPEAALSLIHPDHRLAVRDSIRKAEKGIATPPLQYQINRPDGTSRWVISESEIMFDEASIPIGRLTTFRDITALKAAHEALHEKEKMLSRAQRVSNTGSVTLNFRTKTLEWSDELYRICGVTRGTFIPNREALLALAHPDDRKKIDTALTGAALKDGEQGADAAPLQFRIIRPDGAVRWIDRDAEIWYGHDGKPIGFLATFTDITDKHEAEQRERELQTLLHDAI